MREVVEPEQASDLLKNPLKNSASLPCPAHGGVWPRFKVSFSSQHLSTSRCVEHLLLRALCAAHSPAHSLAKAVGYFNITLSMTCSIQLSQTSGLHLSQRCAESFQVCATWFPYKFPFSSLIFSFHFICVCMYACPAWKWRSKDNLWKSVLSFHHRGSGS